MIKDMNIDPSKILLTTFTNKAANEMKERIVKVVGDKGKRITVGTYHSICNRILRQYCTYINYIKTFSILDADDSEKVIKEIAKENGEDYASLKTFITNCKINCKTPSMAQAEAQAKNTTRLANCYQAYQDRLKRDQCMDFDDLLLNTLLLLESEPTVKEQVNNRWQYISADETQDSSKLDSRLMYALSGPKHNIFFVGDDDQCLVKGTMIETNNGKKKIEDITKEDTLIVACGDGKTTEAKVSSINKKMAREEIYVIKTESGKEIKATGNHIVFSRTKNEQQSDKYIDSFIMFGSKTNNHVLETEDFKYYASYDDLMGIINRSNGEVLMKARLLKDNTTCNFTPVSHLVVGSILYSLNDKSEIVEDKVTSIEKEYYYDYVYDLNVDNYRNYIANDIVVHNCIYSFRGSDVSIILNLKSLYPNLKWYNLGVNYRSTSTIVEAGQEIINHNKTKLQKEVSCGKGIEGAPIIVSESWNQQQEAARVVTFIKTLHNRKTNPMPYKEMAILYRTSYLSHIFEKELMKNKIKYKIIGGTPFFSRMEVKDILAYARLTVNEYDMQSFKRTIAIPKRGVGEKTLENIETFMIQSVNPNISIRKALVDKNLPVKGKAKANIKEYTKYLEDLDQKKVELSPEDFIRYIIQSLEYLNFMKETSGYKEDYQERVENLNELVLVAKEFDNIEDLLVEASIFQDQDNVNEDEDAVQLMTVHKSKGLEFDAVFMTNVVEGTFPHYKSLDDPAQLEEERRVMFVGCTRARKNLFITYPKKQMIMNTERRVNKSRFINEINRKHIKII
jgi:DNA helicase-2/ATP-dependent DNA helicase PcrA